MRTTLTLDDDLAAALKQRAREREAPFKTVVNEAIRAGLAAPPRDARPYRMSSRRLGIQPGVDLDRALGLAAELEDAEIARELEQGR